MASTDKSNNLLNEMMSPEGSECMERLANSFEASARRWELIVYPSLIAFILLAAYGFWLIYNLTHDISDVASSVRDLTVTVNRDMDLIADRMEDIADSTAYMRTMSRDIGMMTGDVRYMAGNVNNMQYSMWQLNRNVSTPFNMMENAMPFGSRSYGRGSSRIAPPIYPTLPAYQPVAPVHAGSHAQASGAAIEPVRTGHQPVAAVAKKY